MLEFILHTLGFCTDSHSHIDLMDLMMVGLTGVSLMWYTIRYRVKCVCHRFVCVCSKLLANHK